jgi:hypothetical protein
MGTTETPVGWPATLNMPRDALSKPLPDTGQAHSQPQDLASLFAHLRHETSLTLLCSPHYARYS